MRSATVLLAAGFLLLCIFPRTLPAQTTNTLDTGTATRVDEAVEKVIADTGIPSASIALVEHGQIVYLRAYGQARLEPPIRQSEIATTANLERVSGSSRANRDRKSSARETNTNTNPGNRASGRKEANSMGLYIGIGVSVVVLSLAGYFIFGGKPKIETAKEKAKSPVFVDNDKTPSYEYGRRADEYLKSKDSMNAVRYYRLAAERADKEGNSKKAVEYNMRLESAAKASTLH